MGARSSKSYSKTTPLTEEEKMVMRAAKWSSSKDRQELWGAAAYKGDGRLVALLLNKYPQILDGENREELTALHLAAWAGHQDVVALLLNHPRTDVSKTWIGATALHFAARAGHADVVALLLNHVHASTAAMLNSNVNTKNKRGRTALLRFCSSVLR